MTFARVGAFTGGVSGAAVVYGISYMACTSAGLFFIFVDMEANRSRPREDNAKLVTDFCFSAITQNVAINTAAAATAAVGAWAGANAAKIAETVYNKIKGN